MAKSVKNKKRRVSPTLRVSDSKEPEQAIEATKRSAFSGWPMIIGWLAMLIFTFHACTHMVAAGDTWVAMACGRHFVNHGVDTVEPFSANSHKAGPTEEEIKTWPNWAQWITDKVGIKTVKYWHPTGWINQNWLTHVIFYSLVPKSSYADGVSFPSNALVYWKFAIYILTVICVYYTGRLLGVNPALCAVFSCFAMFTGRSFLDIRPAGFSNMLVAVFLLILVLTTYRNVLYIWLIVPVTVFWCNVHGGYIYVFIMLIPFIGLHLLTNCNRKWTAILYNVTAWPFLYFILSKVGLTLPTFLFFILVIVLDIVLIFFKKNLVSIGWKGLYHTIAAYFVAFLATVVFNPFHLTNLTHTFVISVSEHAARWRDIHEWHPAFDWTNPVGTAVPFLVMYIIAWLVLLIWAVVLLLTSKSVGRRSKRKTNSSEEYQWPKIDLPLMLIAALTIYMAIRSRRFIPIAAIAACPVIAMFIDRIIRAISAARNFERNKRLIVSVMPYDLQLFFILAGAGAVLFFGTWWGLKFKRIYLDSWPRDPKFTSMFMRMTDSSQKPFYACKFIKDNKLQGKMFNYWTEGGFIAWGQEPDPNTGRTPLQLFMDGRAQAAYNREAFEEWSTIMAGGQYVTGQIVARAIARRQNITSADYVEIGQWMDKQLRDRNVWVVLMPRSTFGTPPPEEYYRKTSYHAVQGIERHPDWRLVFFNNKQKLFVDIRTTQGKQLYDGIFNGETLYPDDFSKNLILSRNTLLFLVNQLEQQRRQIEMAKKTVGAKLNNENLAINVREKTVAQLRKKLAELSEQLKTVQEQLEVAEKEERLELEELENQKDQIEKEKKSIQAKLDNENAVIKAKEKVVAEFREKLTQLSEQLKTVQKRLRDAKQQGFDFAVEAFNLNSSPAPMREIILVASGFAELKPHVKKFCEDYVNNFIKNEADWANQDGYRDRVEATRLACFYLENVARTQGDTKLTNFYNAQETKCLGELLRVAQVKRW
jgi:hypothetical protein